MGFRSPITSLRADQITAGELGPDVVAHSIAAGAIDGQVITGAVVRSSSGGDRVQLDATGLNFRDDDLVYGRATPNGGGGVNPTLTLAASGQDATPGGAAATLRLIGAVAVATADPTEIAIEAEQITLSGAVRIGTERVLRGTVSVQQASTVGFTMPAGGGSADVTGSVIVTAPAAHGVLSLVLAVGAVTSGTVAAADQFSIWRDGAAVKIARPAILNNPVPLFYAESIPAAGSHSYRLHWNAAGAGAVTSDDRFVYLLAISIPIG